MKAATRLLLVAALVVPGSAQADGPSLTARDIARLDREQLDALFATADATVPPTGLARGRVLLRVVGKAPRARARLDGVAWKGKVFHGDGTFTNQWVGFRAITGTVELGTSWADGRPCVVLEYPPGTRVFGNARDELREVSPGVWLGRFYERCPCGTFQGYFVLERGCR